MRQKAFALISTVLLISLILLLVINVLTLAQTEKRINSSFTASQKAYYLAEAGIAKAVWLIKNDSGLADSFESDPDWEYTFNEDNVFSSRGHLSVTIANTDLADAEVTSTASFDLGSGTASQRVVKARIYRTLSESPISNLSLLAGDDIYIWATGLYTNPGSLLAGDNLEADGFSWLEIADNTGAINDLNIRWLSELHSDGLNQAANCSGSISPACQGLPTPVSLPNIDFDSSDPNSWKNRADYVYSYQEFRDMLRDNNPLEVNGVIYVTGKVFVKKGQSLIVNGVLVADDNIDVGNDYQSSPTSAKIIVNHTTEEPSGLFSKSF